MLREVVVFDKLTVIVKDSERFVDDLERLCRKHAGYAYFMKCSVDSELESNEKEGAIKYGKEERQ